MLRLCRRAALAPGSHWNEEYPNEDILRWDINHCALYQILGSDDQLIELISIGQIGELDMLPWPDLSSSAAEAARFGLDPLYQGQGLGKEIFCAAAAQCFSRGFQSLRFLVASDDLRLQKLYQRCGGRPVGRQHLWGSDFEQYVLMPNDLHNL